jgi:hypothetical protein
VTAAEVEVRKAAEIAATFGVRLAGLRQFSRHAVRRRIMLINPTAGLNARQIMAFRGPTLPADRQRALLRWWSTDPARCTRTRRSPTPTIDHDSHGIRLGNGPHPTALDPWAWTALQHSVSHPDALGSNNFHLSITL